MKGKKNLREGERKGKGRDSESKGSEGKYISYKDQALALHKDRQKQKLKE